MKDIRVLIAEDDYLVSEMIRGLLEEAGHKVVAVAATGLEAVEMTQAIRPDVVLMDIQMPDLDGVEATRRIYECCPTPVVALTAYETPTLVEQASAAGVGAYLLKPAASREMERAITIAMARFEDMMELRRLNAALAERNQELEQALAQVKKLSGLLPICASCKKIRDDEGYWHEVEVYIYEHSEADFTHGICPDCAKKLYPAYFD